MLKLQNEVNTLSKPDWKKDSPNYALAAVLELAEALEHTPWKWWKSGKLDDKRLFMEIVDTIHFVFSIALLDVDDRKHSKTINTLARKFSINTLHNKPLSVYEQKIVESAITRTLIPLTKKAYSKNYSFDPFECVADLLKITNLIGYNHMDVFTSYIGKNVLNRFRQANGYKEGTYIKIWSEDKEDNDYLQEYLAANIDLSPTALMAGAFKHLTDTYPSIKS